MKRRTALNAPRRPTRCRPTRGFTLVELMVAIFVMALLALLSWRGLDGMVRAQAYTQARSDQVLTLQAALGQWAADLEANEQATPQNKALDWDGRGLRIVRRSGTLPSAGWLVVAWSRREAAGGGQWLRWQSPEVWRQGDLQQAWEQAAQWIENATPEQRQREVALLPLAGWQLYYFIGGAWSNPLSSTGTVLRSPLPNGQPPIPGFTAPVKFTPPDGVRLVLDLPPGHPLAGRLIRDWVRPTVGGGKT